MIVGAVGSGDVVVLRSLEVIVIKPKSYFFMYKPLKWNSKSNSLKFQMIMKAT